MAEDNGGLLWSSARWRELAVGWIDEQLAAAGTTRTGAVEQPRVRPWGTVLVAPTTGGPVWFKAPATQTAFEVGLYEFLHQVAPEHVLAPIATDVARGWMLLPDGGPVLAECATGEDLVAAFVDLLPEYAQLQRALAPHVENLLAVGVADMRPAIMPARFDEMLQAVERQVDRHGGEAERETYQRLVALREIFAAWCERLAGAPGRPSLDHNDLHPWNVFVRGRRFYDWGDSVVAHPFSTMLVTLGFLQTHMGASHDDPVILRIRDSYLQAFSDLAPLAELVETMELACRVGKVARVLVWKRALGTLEPGEFDHEASAPMVWLASLLDGDTA